MRKLATALALASLVLTPACGGEDEVETGALPADTTESAGAGATAGTDAPVQDGVSQTLLATVGEEGDPDAFVITLTDQSGQPVETLPAGDYTIEVTDPSPIHNFHLAGPGGVDESTTVPEVVDTAWQVTLTEGDYTYVCDPHPGMVGGFTVTG